MSCIGGIGKNPNQKCTFKIISQLWCKKHTKFAEKEIIKWFRRFRALCPRGNLTPDKLDTVYHKLFIGGDASFFVQQARKYFPHSKAIQIISAK